MKDEVLINIIHLVTFFQLISKEQKAKPLQVENDRLTDEKTRMACHAHNLSKNHMYILSSGFLSRGNSSSSKRQES